VSSGNEIPQSAQAIFSEKNDAVDDDFDRVFAALVERLHVFGEDDFAIHPDAHESRATRFCEQLTVFALPVDEQRRENQQAGLFRRR